jgi:Cu/Ag efflux pump CusA
VPILITSLTTIAGLFSLATGLGGKSLIWGPVATAIVWGLAFSTILTLIAIPLLYQAFMPNRGRRDGPISTADGEKTVAANDSNPLHGQEKTV